ncbi:MAG TPA: malto-oligosyltrehalose trehalohydrolase [Myxococcota bacterium]|nr:malto-oligosyltrehalose trehalohydrolase [Myxococcota bacterium]
MKRAHAMPFGAEPRGEDGTRFRLWAPTAASVTLALEVEGRVREHPLEPVGDGWLEARVSEARPGRRYHYVVDGATPVPDPASRFQPDGVHGPSEIVDPGAFEWPDAGWQGRPWHETVLYELHLGSFCEAGDYEGATARLDHLVELGVTALELMPLSDCPGARSWGYDGVLPFAPTARHGRPAALKRLVSEAHARGLMVFLDVVYNHFGPDGNLLPRYAASFFDERRPTPWGPGLAFSGPGSSVVREFFVHNALYWLEEYHLDGLRLDAVHAIVDDSDPPFLSELARTVRERMGEERHVHLVLENDANEAHWLARGPGGGAPAYDAQWNDDLHHALHVTVSGERDGYYADFADRPLAHLGRCLAEGFAWQGEPSPYRDGEARGEPSAALPPTAFVAFLQNHDQIGNRAFGERIDRLAPPQAVAAAEAVLLLSPQVPLLFMGEEWGASEPFPFFCDFEPGLAEAVREGRRREFARFPTFRDAEARERIPDPGAPGTFASAVLDWGARAKAPHREHLARVRGLLALRAEEITPRLRGAPGGAGRHALVGDGGLCVRWRLGDGSVLELLAQLAPGPAARGAGPSPGRLLFATHPDAAAPAGERRLPAWSVAFTLEAKADARV